MKLIIVNRSKNDIKDILLKAYKVVEMGRVSDDGKSYCHVTKFHDDIVCWAVRNNKSDTLTFWNDCQKGGGCENEGGTNEKN